MVLFQVYFAQNFWDSVCPYRAKQGCWQGYRWFSKGAQLIVTNYENVFNSNYAGFQTGDSIA